MFWTLTDMSTLQKWKQNILISLMQLAWETVIIPTQLMFADRGWATS